MQSVEGVCLVIGAPIVRKVRAMNPIQPFDSGLQIFATTPRGKEPDYHREDGDKGKQNQHRPRPTDKSLPEESGDDQSPKEEETEKPHGEGQGTQTEARDYMDCFYGTQD
jgi:hypothetical protein